MAYEFERDEWRSALRSTPPAEQECQRDAYRTAIGVTGDITDAYEDIELPFDDEDDR